LPVDDVVFFDFYSDFGTNNAKKLTSLWMDAATSGSQNQIVESWRALKTSDTDNTPIDVVVRHNVGTYYLHQRLPPARLRCGRSTYIFLQLQLFY
jgi:hypothetical protein